MPTITKPNDIEECILPKEEAKSLLTQVARRERPLRLMHVTEVFPLEDDLTYHVTSPQFIFAALDDSFFLGAYHPAPFTVSILGAIHYAQSVNPLSGDVGLKVSTEEGRSILLHLEHNSKEERS